ncbi:unnamed protein product [Dibothriocephalus latus]|uniref:Uncharacterized protein n=1 Tax=Dibothriocephalus latus TaxID=60516 RepID=A0A3P7LKH6_DIBLA|nr:unnamed protein product [Dibothriocephalus latus]
MVADLEDARAEISSLRAEIEGLMVYQDDLHHDFELVQSMLEDRQSEVERLQQDLLVAQTRAQSDFESPLRKLQRRITEPCSTLEERDEDLYVLNEAKVDLSTAASYLAGFHEQLPQSNRRTTNVAGILTPDSDSDTDCVSEDYLPFDCPGGEAIVSNLQTTPILGAPQPHDSAQQEVQQGDVSTPEAVKVIYFFVFSFS